MIIVLSPSKSMDMEPATEMDATQPAFLDQSKQLIAQTRKLSTAELMKVMQISEKLAELNRQRFKEWKLPFTTDNAKQAALAFTGDVYDGLDASSLKKRDMNFAQKNLRILSGLYGLLRPLDLIQTYRLEMGRPLETRDAKNLHAFWKESVTAELNRAPSDLLINLASQEYFKVIDKRKLDKQIITPTFKDEKNGKLKIISFFAKKARGAMARYIIQNRVTDADKLRTFAWEGYTHSLPLSTPSEPIFTRKEQS